MPLLVRLVPMMRRRVADALAAIRTDKAGRLAEQWYDEWHPELDARIAELRDVDLEALGDPALDADTGRAAELLRWGTEIHFTTRLAVGGGLSPRSPLPENGLDCRVVYAGERVIGFQSGSARSAARPERRGRRSRRTSTTGAPRLAAL